MWRRLRARQFFDLRFRRQDLIGPYIVDFYCSQLRLVVEIDGDVHAKPEQKLHDTKREYYLTQLGLHVFHVNNDDVIHNIDGILEALRTLTLTLSHRARG